MKIYDFIFSGELEESSKKWKSRKKSKRQEISIQELFKSIQSGIPHFAFSRALYTSLATITQNPEPFRSMKLFIACALNAAGYLMMIRTDTPF
jgi:hypothetical protein